MSDAPQSPLALGLRRFRGDRLAMAGLWLLGMLFVLAVGAPLLASDRPFVLHVPPGAQPPGAFGALPEGWSSPWLLSLLDDRLYESTVDHVFNALLLLAPIAVPLGWWLRRRRAAHWQRRRAAYALAVLAAALLLGVGASGPQTSRDYAGRVERLRAGGADVTAVFPPIPRAPRSTAAEDAFAPPSSEHWIGTDGAGRDVFVRLLYGIRISLTIGLVSVSIYVGLGLVLGALAGYFRGFVDACILRLIEVVACFPTLLLILTLIAVVETRSIFHVMLAIGLTGWPTVARLVRAEFLRQTELDYATAAHALGLRPVRVIFRHLLPNALAPVLVTAAFGVAGAILVESALSFLSLGDPTIPSWGEVLRVGRESGELHLILAPGLLIFLTVIAMNVVAEGLRDAIDPRLHRR